jgi:low affinity Fe/Cu permease
MVFLIQNTQNRDAKAIHLKLDELIRALEHARTELVDLEHLSDEELARLQAEFEHLRHRANGTTSEAADSLVAAVEDEREERQQVDEAWKDNRQ